MKIAAAIEKMTDFYKGNIHDIYHFLLSLYYHKLLLSSAYYHLFSLSGQK